MRAAIILLALAALGCAAWFFIQAAQVTRGPVMIPRDTLAGWMIIAGLWAGFFAIMSLVALGRRRS